MTRNLFTYDRIRIWLWHLLAAACLPIAMSSLLVGPACQSNNPHQSLAGRRQAEDRRDLPARAITLIGHWQAGWCRYARWCAVIRLLMLAANANPVYRPRSRGPACQTPIPHQPQAGRRP